MGRSINRTECTLCALMASKYPDDEMTDEGLIRHCGRCGQCGYSCGCDTCVEGEKELARSFLVALGMNPNQVK